ncbi:MAG: hypothetical protein IJ622_03745 [Bacteroidales bacterium]|nr:hypothetical protein [Bacteroidales bacterium]
MKFNEKHKTALAKVLSDLVQCDGIVNQGEIDYLQRAYEVFGITLTSRQKAMRLSLSDAVATLRTLGQHEKSAILWVFQRISVSDDSLDATEKLLLTALLLAIGIDLPQTRGINAKLVSIASLDFETRDAIIYVEPDYDPKINASIERDYEAICKQLRKSRHEFFYLPHVIRDLEHKKQTFRNTLSYIEPTLSAAQLDQIDRNLSELSSVFLSKEIFINYLNSNGLKINKPSFLMKIGNLKPGPSQDFLIVETGDDPLKTLRRISRLHTHILKIHPALTDAKERLLVRKMVLKMDQTPKDELNYTGLHKIILDTLLKYNANRELSRLYITKKGEIILTDRNNTEVKMPALCKALYVFFLLHPDGVLLSHLNDHKKELYHIYRQISSYSDDDLLHKAIDNLTNFVGATMNVNFSRIRKAFRDLIGDEAAIYLIKGEKGGRKIIHLDRSLVVFEDVKAFE